MDINSRFENIDQIKSFLNQLNNQDWGESKIPPLKIKKFIQKYIHIIANQQDKELHDTLIQLSNHVFSKWENPEGNSLAFDIMGVAKGVLPRSEKHAEAPGVDHVPADVWGQIFWHISPREYKDSYRKQLDPSGLKNVYPSQRLSDIARREEKNWIGDEVISLKQFGCTTAKEAVEFAIKNKLTGANLSEFPDLVEHDLEVLFKNCPNLTQLFIKSYNIRNLSAAASNLVRLVCDHCDNLQSLPDKMPNVQILDCHTCRHLQNLPDELPNVQELDYQDCDYVKNTPKVPAEAKVYNNEFRRWA